MKILTLLAAFVLGVSSLIPLIRLRQWWIRVFDFPRLQILVLGLTILVVYLVFWEIRHWAEGAILGLLVVGLLIQAWRILPYSPLYPKEVLGSARVDDEASRGTIALLVANVLMSNRDSDRLLRIIRDSDPDVIITLEPDGWWEQQLCVLEDDYPHTVREPRENRYGMLVHSRLELLNPEIKHLISDEIPSVHTRVRLASGAIVWLHCLHPEPPSPTEAEESTERDAELLIVGRKVRDRDEPTIVSGDLNDVAWSFTTTLFQKISKLLDPRKGRGMFNTYHAEYPFMRWPLDHVFHSEHFTLQAMTRLPAFGSDHFPVCVRLTLHPAAAAIQEEVDSDQEDREQAEERIEEAEQQEQM